MSDITTNLFRIKKLMLVLYLRFIVNDAHFKEIVKIDHSLNDDSDNNTCLRITYFLEIASNLTLFCRNYITNNSVDHRPNGLLFSPSINEHSAL